MRVDRQATWPQTIGKRAPGLLLLAATLASTAMAADETIDDATIETIDGITAGTAEAEAGNSPAASHIEVVPAELDAASIFLAARLTDQLDRRGVGLPAPTDDTALPEQLRLETRGVIDIARPGWQVEARYEPGAVGLPSLIWSERSEDYAGLATLADSLSDHLAAVRGEAAPAPTPTGELRSREELLHSLLAPQAVPNPNLQLLRLAELCERCLRHDEDLAALFAPENEADPNRPEAATADIPTCAWLELRIHPLTRTHPEQALLLDELLLPLGIDAQLLDARPSLALLCWGLTQPTRLGRGLTRLDPTRQRVQLDAALNRRFDPELQPHWPGLRGQLRTGLLLAHRHAEPGSPFVQALSEALADSQDGDDLLLGFAIALHHLDEVAPEHRQQAADALWQARPLWTRHPGFRPYLQALAADIATDLDSPPSGQPAPNFDAGSIPAQWLLPALLSLDPDSSTP